MPKARDAALVPLRLDLDLDAPAGDNRGALCALLP